jgi:hypothetical protein
LLRFLLAQLHLDSLIDKTTPKAIKLALEKLPKGSHALDCAYQEAMERIEGQKRGFQELAKQVLSWVTCTKRPLTTLELQYALAVEIGETELDKENLSGIEEMVSVCAGLVTVDEESNLIRLVHYTTQEYFERTQASWFPNAETDIAETCGTYLSFDTFESGCCATHEEFKERLQLNPLYNYAARNWEHHVRAASKDVQCSVLGFLENEAKLSACIQTRMTSPEYPNIKFLDQEAPSQMTGLHFAAWCGLTQITTTLLKKGYQPACKDSYGLTPLWWAAEHGHEAVVKLLVERDDVEADSKNRCGQTPLSRAAENGHEAVVRLLVERNDVEADLKDFGGQATSAA